MSADLSDAEFTRLVNQAKALGLSEPDRLEKYIAEAVDRKAREKEREAKLALQEKELNARIANEEAIKDAKLKSEEESRKVMLEAEQAKVQLEAKKLELLEKEAEEKLRLMQAESDKRQEDGFSDTVRIVEKQSGSSAQY